jgi:hypothetical protein
VISQRSKAAFFSNPKGSGSFPGQAGRFPIDLTGFVLLRPSKIATNLDAVSLDRETTKYTEYTEENCLLSVYSIYSVVFHVMSAIESLASTLDLATPGEDFALRASFDPRTSNFRIGSTT